MSTNKPPRSNLQTDSADCNSTKFQLALVLQKLHASASFAFPTYLPPERELHGTSQAVKFRLILIKSYRATNEGVIKPSIWVVSIISPLLLSFLIVGKREMFYYTVSADVYKGTSLQRFSLHITMYQTVSDNKTGKS